MSVLRALYYDLVTKNMTVGATAIQLCVLRTLVLCVEIKRNVLYFATTNTTQKTTVFTHDDHHKHLDISD